MSELLPIHQELQRKELLSKWGIRLGNFTQRSYPNEIVNVSVYPHVFFANSLLLDSLRTEDKVGVDGAMVMAAHGMLGGNNREWRFIGTNKSVTETVSAYDKVAKNIGWPLIDAVLACRGMDTDKIERLLESEKNSRARIALSSVSILASSVPQIFPGASGVNVAGRWEKGKGTLWIRALSLEWQGLDRWQKYWEDHKEERARIQIPGWAKGKAS